jgi:hypothetical protein
VVEVGVWVGLPGSIAPVEEAATAAFGVAGGEDTAADKEGERSWTVEGAEGERTDTAWEGVQA